MKTTVLSVFAFSMLLTVSAYAQSKPTEVEARREVDRQVRAQKIEKSKAELKEIGQDVKEKAKVVGEAVSTEAKKAGETIERKVEERKAKRSTTRRDTL